MEELTKSQKSYRRQRSPRTMKEAADRARKWRAENREKHREAERARYKKMKEEDPEGLRKQRTENMRRWRAENPERSREIQKKSAEKNKPKLRCYNLRKKYGLTAEQVDQMFLSQGSKCLICECVESTRGWAVDHCHSTKKVRGILCHHCNTGLGLFRDSPDNLKAAINYLER